MGLDTDFCICIFWCPPRTFPGFPCNAHEYVQNRALFDSAPQFHTGFQAAGRPCKSGIKIAAKYTNYKALGSGLVLLRESSSCLIVSEQKL
jgi:hypothetical protein